MSNEAEREAIFQALGEASVCWEHPEGAGVFDASRAAEVGERLIEALARIRDGGPVSNERRRRELEVLSAADALVGLWDRLGWEHVEGMRPEPDALRNAMLALRSFEDEEAENERLVELERRLARRRRGGQAGLGRVPVRPRREVAAVTPRTRTAESSPSTDTRQDDAERWEGDPYDRCSSCGHYRASHHPREEFCMSIPYCGCADFQEREARS